jgi:hypothetical protein
MNYSYRKQYLQDLDGLQNQISHNSEGSDLFGFQIATIAKHTDWASINCDLESRIIFNTQIKGTSQLSSLALRIKSNV